MRAYCAATPRHTFLDINPVLIDSDGKPRLELYQEDKLHFHPPAYVEFAAIIKPVLTRVWEAAVASTPTPSAKPISENKELQEFLNCQLVPKLGNAWDYVFAPGPTPRVEWDRPEVVEKVMGSFPLKVRWFDGDGREVRSAERPGRYAFYAEGTTPGGITIRRSATLFCSHKDWDGFIRFYAEGFEGNLKQVALGTFYFKNGQDNLPPVISNVICPDAVSRGINFVFSVKTFDPNGRVDILSTFFSLYRPDGTPVEENPGDIYFAMDDSGNLEVFWR